jgi:hypothetical protein
MFKRTGIFVGYSAYTLVLFIIALGAVETVFQLNDNIYKNFRYYLYDPPIYAPSDKIPYKLRKNFEDIHTRRGDFTVTIRTNSQGLRENRTIEIPKPPNTFRIITMGDSFGFAYGVEREASFQQIAEEVLNAEISGKNIEVINMGYASAYSPDAAWVYLRDEAFKYQPDAIIHVLTHTNDFGNVVQNIPFSKYDNDGLPLKVQYFPVVIDPETGHRTGRFGFEIRRAQAHFFPEYFGRNKQQNDWEMLFSYLRHGNWTSALQKIRLYQVINYFILMQQSKVGDIFNFNIGLVPQKRHRLGDEAFLRHGDAKNEYNPVGVRQRGWVITKRIYKAMNRLAKQHSARFGVVLVPDRYMIEYDPAEGESSPMARWSSTAEMERALKVNKPKQVICGFLEKEDIACLDPTEGMRQNKKEAFYFVYDAHWNAAGHGRVGELMAKWILENKWIK